jgi:predicted O-methyltransferase YrrM
MVHINSTNEKSKSILKILEEFGIDGESPEKGGTDKNTAHSYLETYENLLSSLVKKNGSLLEIGIRNGGSIILWSEFLPHFKIYGLDIEKNSVEYTNNYFNLHSDKVFIEYKDAYAKDTIDYLKSINPNGFDVIIDDGPHTEQSQIDCIRLYLDLLKEDGILIIEDIQNFDSIEVFKKSIPYSKFFEYEIDVYDLRETKGRYDDVLFCIRKKEKKISDKIAIFYHVGQFGDWKRVFHEQINNLIITGLYHKVDFIHIGINGEEELPLWFPKFILNYNNNKTSEADTLKSLHDFCIENQEYKVFYFHTKGVTQDISVSISVSKWRYYLEYFTIHNWKDCVQALEKYDTAGAEYLFQTGLTNQDTGLVEWEENPHYAGNFWWSTSSYISKLDPNYLYRRDKGWDRYRSEFWIGTGNPSRKIFYSTGIFDKYGDWGNVSPLNYVKEKNLNTNSLEILKLNPMKNKVFIITPCTRPFNLSKISQTIPEDCEWIVVFDSKIKKKYSVDNVTILESPFTGLRGYQNNNHGLDYIANNLNPSDNDWVMILHDDNIIHPKWWDNVKDYLDLEYSIITWGQCFSDETLRINSTENPKVGNIDTSQYMVRWNVAKNLRFEDIYEADGIYAEESAKQGSVKKLDQYLGYYNFLRAHKSEQEIRTNICMISMFKNESKGIRRMLESVWRHIDFYVFQDNGSTDGTPDIVREFFADKNIPGFIYEVEEGWVGFGWNRDHLLQTTLRNDHGCDWIMKMDCDEYLEVDDDFDWSYFYNTNTESFHVTAQNPGCIYYRAWIWNAKLPWKFQHDPAHEVIYLDNDKGENFERVNLPRGLRMIGTPDGESYSVRTKYITDALKLEEKMIREETMLTDTYHFWYIAKSYQDCFRGNFYPLGEAHSKEFARRFIFYFEEYLKFMNAEGIHEMSYFSAVSIGLGYKYLGEIDKAIEWFNNSERYCPVRNEHIVYLAQTYDELGQYDKMLEQTTRLLEPDRKLPFPDYYFLIDSNIYNDSSNYPQELHNYALSKINTKQTTINSFSINVTTKPRIWIVDDFYADPYAIREFALQQEFEPNLNYYKGSRSHNQYIVPGTKEAFEKIMGRKITNWTETHGMCGRFQYCTAEDALVYHCDGQTFAGMIYLTPDAPVSCGTSLFAHKKTGLRNENDFGNVDVFGETGFYDRTKFELVDTAGNVFNRLVLFDAKCIHSANEYFGTDITNSRLFHLFFFD